MTSIQATSSEVGDPPVSIGLWKCRKTDTDGTTHFFDVHWETPTSPGEYPLAGNWLFSAAFILAFTLSLPLLNILASPITILHYYWLITNLDSQMEFWI